MATITLNNLRAPQDVEGQPLQSHGGHILSCNGYFYLYGEDRRAGLKVSCYRSRDLVSWEYRGTALSIDSPVVGYPLTRTDRRLRNPQLDPQKTWNIGVTIERPKVLYNQRTGKYVMWMHFEDGNNYLCAHAAVASCDTPDGAFVYHGSFRPAGHMSRDCTLFQDDDGTAYFISAARDNADLHIYRLTQDYMAIDTLVASIFPQQFREAPALFKRNGIYFMVSSECTGWEPNQGRYSWARRIEGPWADHQPFGSPTTNDTQPAFVLEIPGSKGQGFLYVGDRWDPTDYFNSRYIALPFTFPTQTSLDMAWADTVDIDLDTGVVSTAMESGDGPVRIASRGTDDYVTLPRGTEPGRPVGSIRLDYQNPAQLFDLQPVEGGQVRIVGRASGLALASYSHEVVAAYPSDDPNQLWKLEPQAENLTLIRAHDGRVMAMQGEQHAQATLSVETQAAYFDTSWFHSPQGFIIAPVVGQDPIPE